MAQKNRFENGLSFLHLKNLFFELEKLPECSWNDPEQFRPERFLNNPLSHKFSYLPFGGGPRLCIGMQFAMLEILIILTRIFQNYKLSMDQQPLTLEPLITLRPKTKLNLKLEKI